VDLEYTFDRFCESYATEEACLHTLISLRWPQGFRCPRCEHSEFYLTRTRRLPLFECRSCRLQTSPISGTIMEGSRTPIRLWFQAIFLHARPRGISATRLAELLRVTYKTAWLICHKIRHAMTDADSKEWLSGIVRINCGVYGRPYNPTVYRHPQEQPLLAGATVDEDENVLRLKIKRVPEAFFLQDRIVSEGGRHFERKYVSRKAKEVRIVVQPFSRLRHLPLIRTIREAASWINLTFNGIGPKHLQSYLDQFCYGWNRRADNDVFFELLRQSVAAPTITYPQLIRRPDASARLKRIYRERLKSAC